jgi:hypothetical protein
VSTFCVVSDHSLPLTTVVRGEREIVERIVDARGREAPTLTRQAIRASVED